MIVLDACALAVGTLTRLPVPAPRRVDRRVAGLAMLLAPLVGAALGLAVGLGVTALVDHSSISPLLAAVVAVGALAYLTRAIHLDGLADTADALGSGRPAAQALAIARRSDIGPFGVVAIVVIMSTQAAATAQAVDLGRAPVLLAVALAGGRLAMAAGCLRSVPAARPEGLGSAVAGSVPLAAFVLVALGTLVAGAMALGWPAAAAAVAGALVVGWLVLRVAVRRLGGMTGDVLGAAAEVSSTVSLVILIAVGA